MEGYKAFNKGMTCNGKQYAEHTIYEEQGGDICCEGMMHFCKEPFDVLDYYPLVDENGDFCEFAKVEALDKVKELPNKCATKKLKIGAKISFHSFIKVSIDVLIRKTKPKIVKRDKNLSDNEKGKAQISSYGDEAQISSSGDEAQIGSSGDDAKIGSSGDWAQIGSSGDVAKIGSSGDKVQIGSSGNWAQIGSSGDEAKICASGDKAHIGCSGDDAKIGSSGYRVQIGSSGDDAKIGSSGDRAKICASGDRAHISSSGDEAQIGSSGDEAKIKMEGKRSVGSAIGHNCKISGKKGDWIVLAEWKKMDDGKWYPTCVKAEQIDGKTLKEDTFYKLEYGKFVEETVIR